MPTKKKKVVPGPGDQELRLFPTAQLGTTIQAGPNVMTMPWKEFPPTTSLSMHACNTC